MRLKTLLIISAITTPILIVIMALHGAPLKLSPVTPLGILDLEFAGKVERASEIYNAWKPEVLQIAVNNTLIDFLFLTSYGCFLYACCLTLANLYSPGWRKLGLWSARLALIAAVFDVVENILMFRTLSGNIYKEMVASIFMFAAAKFFIVFIAVIYILLSLAGLLFKRKVRSSEILLN